MVITGVRKVVVVAIADTMPPSNSKQATCIARKLEIRKLKNSLEGACIRRMRDARIESVALSGGKSLVLVGETEDGPRTKMPASLQSLALINCTFEFPQGDVQAMHSLVELVVVGCSFDYIPSSIFQSMMRMCKLDMSHSELSVCPKEICQLPMLIDLRLDGNNLKELPRELRALSRLESLSARDNKLTLGVCTFPPTLKRLFVSGNKIPVIPDLPETLQVLCASRNEITGIPASLLELKQLHTLDLRKNNISGWPELHVLPRLSTLLIAGNADGAPADWTPAMFAHAVLFDTKALNTRAPEADKKKRYRCTLLLVRWNISGEPTCSTVKPVGSQLTLENCFIIIGKESVYVYLGAKARYFDVASCISVASKIADESQRKVLFYHLLSDKGRTSFWKLLRCDSEPEVTAKRHESASLQAEYLLQRGSLSRVDSDDAELISEGSLTRSLMKSEHAYMLRTAGELYLWLGANLSSQGRDAAFSARNAAISELKRKQPHSLITTFEEGCETMMFRHRFQSWPEVSRVYTKDEKLQSKSPHKQLLSERVLSIELQKVLEDGSTESVPGDLYGVLFSDQAYVLTHASRSENTERFIFHVFAWLGADTIRMETVLDRVTQSIVDRVTTIAKTKTTVVVQRQYKEHPVFVSALGGISVCDGLAQEDADIRLFQVRAFAGSYRAFEMEGAASSLCSRDVFLLIVPESLTAYTWVGKGADEVNIENCKKEAIRLLGAKAKEFLANEGEEPELFWEALGGKKSYSTNVDANVNFCVTSLIHHTMFSNYIDNFSQYDLDPSCVVTLSAGNAKWRWVGPFAPQTLRDAKGEGETTAEVKFGEEPIDFKSIFPGWNSQTIDPSKKEKALTDEEFQWVYNCDRKTFYSLAIPLAQAMRSAKC